MMRHGMAPMIGLALLLAPGCVDSEQDEVAESADPERAPASEMHQDVQSALDQFGAEMEQLEQQYSAATDDVSANWSDTRAEMREYRDGLEADLARLEEASGDEARKLKHEMAQDLERLTERFERAKLESIEDNREFLSASRDQMVRLEDDLGALGGEAAALSAEAHEEASDELEDFRDRASELRTRLEGLDDATAEEFESRRTDIARAIAALTASVRRELFEIRHAATD